MAFHYITPGRCNLSPLLLTLFFCLGAFRFVALTVPSEVTHIVTTDVTENSFTLSWTPPGGNVTEYRVIIDDGMKNPINETPINATYKASGLDPGVTYTITIYAINGNDTSNGILKNQTTLPSSVSGFHVTDVWTNQMNLSWSIPTDVNAKTYRYKIFIEQLNKSVSSNNSYALITGLSPGSNYNFTIYTVTENEVQSSAFQKISRTTLPSSVSGFHVTDVWTNQMNLSWSIPTDVNAKTYRYNIFIEPLNKSVSSNNSYALITGLSPGSNYNFTIYTVTENGVQSSAFEKISNTTLPSSVSGFHVTDVWTNQMNLSWSIPTDVNAKTYRYNIFIEPLNKSVSSNNSYALITGLSPGSNYNFIIYTMTENGVQSSAFQKISNTTLPSSVSDFHVTDVWTNQMNLSWSIPTDVNAKTYSYNIFIEPLNKSVSSNNSYALITGLSPGSNYNFIIYTVTENGVQSSAFQKISNTTMPSSVSDFHVTDVWTNQMNLSWSIPSDVNAKTYRYNIFIEPLNKSVSSNNSYALITGLSPGSNYNFIIYTVTENGVQSNTSQKISNTTLPSSVSGFHVTDVWTNQMNLSWSIPSDVNAKTYKYNIFIEPLNKSVSSNNSYALITGLSPGSNYNFIIYTVTENGVQSSALEKISNTTLPNAPNNLQGDAVDVSEIYINWTAPEDINEKSYDYQVKWEDTNTTALYNSSNTKDTHLNIKNLLPGHLYKITVISVIQNTPSVNTEIYTATKSLSTEGLSVGNINNTSVTLKWNMPSIPSSIVSGYRITVYLNGNKISENETIEQVYIVDWLLPGNIYSLSVESFARNKRPGTVNRMNTADNFITSYSTPSIIKVETVPDAVRDLKCSIVDAYQIKVDFQCPAGNYSSFNVLVNDDPRSQVDCPNNVLISNLQPAASYRISVRTIATEKSVVSGVIMCDTDSTGVIVGSIFGVLLFLLLIGLIVFFVLRKRRLKDSRDNIPTVFTTRRFHTIPKEKFKEHYENCHADSDFGFAEEYQELSMVGTSQSKRAAELPENKAKNRFTNVLPYDHSRIKLSIMNDIPTSDYTNANYMPGYNSTKEFIASQGPLPNTTADFWRMVWEHQVNTIVMLTNCMENGRVKCDHYWPLDYTPCTYGDISVTVSSETILSEWTIRDFSVKHANQQGIKYLRHFHFTAWPDHGVPESTSSIIQFRSLVREHMDQRKSNGPTVVHCSAGVGRTGTLIALDYLIQQIEKEQRIGIYNFVEKMRMNRNLMVQTEAQYIFLNKCMLDLIDQPEDEHIYENHTGTQLVYENLSAIRNLQRENA
ncbi:receptor-type tyrosine-protein phosphatase H [Rhinoderma darwinii]|uniref:receptor-type tyrosine-protein phosphatase H n=1 Tax=Rhinoderma darwinii TaxID=43563 RepID=UPI003F67FBCD